MISGLSRIVSSSDAVAIDSGYIAASLIATAASCGWIATRSVALAGSCGCIADSLVALAGSSCYTARSCGYSIPDLIKHDLI